MIDKFKGAIALTLFVALAGAAGTVLLWALPAFAQGPAAGAAPLAEGAQWAFVAAALATGLSSLGAGYAVGAVGSAAIGALAERPELLGRLLIFVGLAEGIAIYGLIISILILTRVT